MWCFCLKWDLLLVLGGCPKYALLRFRAKRFTPMVFKCFLSRRSSVLMLSCLTTLILYDNMK